MWRPSRGAPSRGNRPPPSSPPVAHSSAASRRSCTLPRQGSASLPSPPGVSGAHRDGGREGGFGKGGGRVMVMVASLELPSPLAPCSQKQLNKKTNKTTMEDKLKTNDNSSDFFFFNWKLKGVCYRELADGGGRMDSLDTPCLPQSRVLGGVQPIRPVDYIYEEDGRGKSCIPPEPYRRDSWLLCFESCSHLFFFLIHRWSSICMSASRREGREQLIKGYWEAK